MRTRSARMLSAADRNRRKLGERNERRPLSVVTEATVWSESRKEGKEVSGMETRGRAWTREEGSDIQSLRVGSAVDDV